ncbi:MAG: DUF3291 domain-containing protein [Hyphomicrobiales bacterium]
MPEEPLYHIAQINVGTVRYETDDPRMADFMENLDRINELAERSPGFVWRLKDDTNNATNIRLYDNPLLLLNMSVWETIEDLEAFTYKTVHTRFVQRREEWFHPSATTYLALWWVENDRLPTAGEGQEKVAYLEKNGPSPLAFTFKQRFPMPGFG